MPVVRQFAAIADIFQEILWQSKLTQEENFKPLKGSRPFRTSTSTVHNLNEVYEVILRVFRQIPNKYSKIGHDHLLQRPFQILTYLSQNGNLQNPKYWQSTKKA